MDFGFFFGLALYTQYLLHSFSPSPLSLSLCRDHVADAQSSKVRTRDMGGQSTTHEFTRAILDKMETV